MPYQDITLICPALFGTTYFAQILCIWSGNWYIYVWKRSLHSQIKFSNLLFKHTNIYTTQTPKGKNSKVAFRQPSFSGAHPAHNNLAWQNCTQEKNIYSCKNKHLLYKTECGSKSSSWNRTTWSHIAWRKKKRIAVFVPIEKKRPPVLKASSLFVSFFKGPKRQIAKVQSLSSSVISRVDSAGLISL